jgi:hypothetical protein
MERTDQGSQLEDRSFWKARRAAGTADLPYFDVGDEVTYPLKFRQHVLKIRGEEGLSFSQAARRFGVGIASVMRWARKIEPVAIRHRRAQKIDGRRLIQDVAERGGLSGRLLVRTSRTFRSQHERDGEGAKAPGAEP